MASLAACHRLGSTLRQHPDQGNQGAQAAAVAAVPLLKVHDVFFRNSAFLGFPPQTGAGAGAGGGSPLSSPKCSTRSLHIFENTAPQASPRTADQEALVRLDMPDPACHRLEQTFLAAMADDHVRSLPAATSSSSSLSSSDSEEGKEAPNSPSSSCSDICNNGSLDSLSSLSEALPQKRGLSHFFSGKSQSFSSIAVVSSVAELAKPENPYVKRHRTAAAGLSCSSSFPPLPSGSTMNHKRSKRSSGTAIGTRTMTRTTNNSTYPINAQLPLKSFSSPDLRLPSL